MHFQNNSAQEMYIGTVVDDFRKILDIPAGRHYRWPKPKIS